MEAGGDQGGRRNDLTVDHGEGRDGDRGRYRRRRFMICPDPGTRALARFGSVLMPLLNREFDRRARSIAKTAKTANEA